MDRSSWPLLPDGAPAQERYAATEPKVRRGVPMGCVPASLKGVLAEVERRWGTVLVVSTYRKGARIKGTHHRSRHADCRAVDFKPRAGTYHAVAAWLKANHDGGVGTYSGHFNHIHIDDGPAYRWHN